MLAGIHIGCCVCTYADVRSWHLPDKCTAHLPSASAPFIQWKTGGQEHTTHMGCGCVAYKNGQGDICVAMHVGPQCGHQVMAGGQGMHMFDLDGRGIRCKVIMDAQARGWAGPAHLLR
jgi:hypothetical protein